MPLNFSTMDAASQYGFSNFSGEDQIVEDDFIDELIRKYLNSEDMNSFYEDDTHSLPLLASPESDKWPGELMLQNNNYNQDYLVPDLLLMDNIQDLTERYDNAEPDEDLLSILDEIITEDEKKAEGAGEPTLEDTLTETIVQPDLIISSTESASVAQETQSNKKKRSRKTSTDKKAKRSCRTQPIIMKRRAKQRSVQE